MIKKGNLVDSEGIELPTGTIQTLPMESYYKYQGVLKAEYFHNIKVKAKLQEWYKQLIFEWMQSNQGYQFFCCTSVTIFCRHN